MKKKLCIFVSAFFVVAVSGGCTSTTVSDRGQTTAAAQETAKTPTGETTTEETTLVLPDTTSDPMEEIMPQMQDMVTNGEKCAALAVDGSVWAWDEGQDAEEAVKLTGLENITELLCAGPAMYALSGNGDVYVWGSNELWQIDADRDRDVYFAEPIRIAALSDIVELDVSPDTSGKGRLFAVDGNGNFSTCGLYINDDNGEIGPLAVHPELVQDVARTFAGSGAHHYFIREDGTVFSIMDSAIIDSRSISVRPYIGDYLFPQLPVEEHREAPETLYCRDVDTVDLTMYAKVGETSLFELGKEDGTILSMDADYYTMFLSKDDATLWYWDSDMIRFKQDTSLIEVSTGTANYAGCFRQVDVGEVLGLAEGESIPRVVDMRAGYQNFLFLTEDGRVFLSSYEIYGSEGVPHYKGEFVFGVDASRIKFEKLDWENIISINTDGVYQFTAVDAHGEYYHLDLWP